jgi:formylmethanofuran dehydrogenase subunit E-like metal-binding protein
MTDEQRLQMITEQLLIVRDNLFRGMSKSIQKLQARSINEVLELPNHTQSPQRTWVGLTIKDVKVIEDNAPSKQMAIFMTEATLKEKNT